MSDLLRQVPPGQPLHPPRSRAHRAWMLADGDGFLARYFQRIDLKVAASFTPEQRVALKQMFGNHDQGQHLVDFRRSLPLGRRRFYLVLLFGQERRSPERLRVEGALSRATTLAVYLLALAVLAVPAIALLYALEAAAGIELAGGGGLRRLWGALGDQLGLLLGG